MMGFDDESEGEIPAQIWTQLSLNQKLQKPRLEVLQRFRKSSQNFSVSVPTSEIPIIRQSPSQPFLLQLKVVNPQLTTEIRQESRDSIWCTLPFPGCIHSPTAMPNSIEALHLMRGKAHWELTCPKCSEQLSNRKSKVEVWCGLLKSWNSAIQDPSSTRISKNKHACDTIYASPRCCHPQPQRFVSGISAPFHKLPRYLATRSQHELPGLRQLELGCISYHSHVPRTSKNLGFLIKSMLTNTIVTVS